MDYYKRTRVGFRFELPYPADKVTFDTDQMGWVDQTPGYQPKLTTETVNGAQTQVYTCYRLLEPTSNSPTVNPGTSAIVLCEGTPSFRAVVNHAGLFWFSMYRFSVFNGAPPAVPA